METLRTPDSCFEGLADWRFEPRYVMVDDFNAGSLRVHYVDEGPRDAAPILLMHGEPTWSYLYRHMIGPLVDAGHRVVAPDLVGFGRSDKPTAPHDHSYARHVEWMRQALTAHLDLREITMFAQDWGGMIGLRLLAVDPDRFARVVVANTGLPTGHGAPSEAFLRWQAFSAGSPTFPVGRIVAGGCTTELADDVVAAYDAPFPDDTHKVAARVMPSLVPTRADDPASAANEAAWRALEHFDRPFLCAFSDADPITAGGDAPFRSRVPGARGRTHHTIAGAGHFLQEDRGPELADLIASFVRATS